MSILKTLLITFILLVIIEISFSLVFYQKKRLEEFSNLPLLSSTNGLQFILRQFNKNDVKNEIDKFSKLESLRDNKEIKDSYPAYTYNPSLHSNLSTYHLANVSNSIITLCNENGFFPNILTDEFGFINPPNQYGKKIKYTLLGDSFGEGVCEEEKNTIAGNLRKKNKVFNLSRGGTGPLFQLGLLKEYGHLVQTEEIIWLVFLGNDLSNLRKEKATLLSQYLKEDFSQNLVKNKKGNEKKPPLANISNKYGNNYNKYEAFKDGLLFKKIAELINKQANDNNSKLRIILLDHSMDIYKSHFPILHRNIIKDNLQEFAKENQIPILLLDKKLFNNDHYTKPGPHMNAQGYNYVAKLIKNWL